MAADEMTFASGERTNTVWIGFLLLLVLSLLAGVYSLVSITWLEHSAARKFGPRPILGTGFWISSRMTSFA